MVSVRTSSRETTLKIGDKVRVVGGCWVNNGFCNVGSMGFIFRIVEGGYIIKFVSVKVRVNFSDVVRCGNE